MVFLYSLFLCRKLHVYFTTNKKEIEFFEEQREIRKNDFMLKINLIPENIRRYSSSSSGGISYDLLKRNSKQVLEFINGTEFSTAGIITKKIN